MTFFETLVEALMVVIMDEGLDLAFEATREEVVLEQDPFLSV